jgi:hypothetical protein
VKLTRKAACLLFVSAYLLGCHATSESSTVKEVIENRPSINVSDLPTKLLDGFDTSSASSIRAKLKTQDSLTLDGTTLTVGAVGANTTVTIACHKLKMINGARIITNGNQLNLYALEMEFNNSGGIDSFVDDTATAKPEMDGSNGGRVEIYAVDSVFGSLRVSLPGQIGGAGVQGEAGTNGSIGTRGADGADNMFDCGHGGGDGGKGTAGGQGSPGHTGKAGGNGGDLLLQGAAAKDYDSKFPYHGPAGGGGAGGKGGNGGSGGPGGQGGSGSTHCGGGHPGPSGDSGTAGADGNRGPSGTSSGKRYVK